MEKLIDINSKEFKQAVLNIVAEVGTIKHERFERLPDGWILDKEQQLEWGQSSTKEMNFADAEDYCKEQGGRLPTLKELQAIVDYEKHEPAVNKAFFSDTQSRYYWTSTKCAWSTSAAWCVGFIGGGVSLNDVGSGCHVRPVRSSQSRRLDN